MQDSEYCVQILSVAGKAWVIVTLGRTAGAHLNIRSILKTLKLFKMRRVLNERRADSDPPSPPVRIMTPTSTMDIATTKKSNTLNTSEKKSNVPSPMICTDGQSCSSTHNNSELFCIFPKVSGQTIQRVRRPRKIEQVVRSWLHCT